MGDRQPTLQPRLEGAVSFGDGRCRGSPLCPLNRAPSSRIARMLVRRGVFYRTPEAVGLRQTRNQQGPSRRHEILRACLPVARRRSRCHTARALRSRCAEFLCAARRSLPWGRCGGRGVSAVTRWRCSRILCLEHRLTASHVAASVIQSTVCGARLLKRRSRGRIPRFFTWTLLPEVFGGLPCFQRLSRVVFEVWAP
jgi:hypothetical protein